VSPLGSANSFGYRPLGEIPDISANPDLGELLRSQYLTNTGAFAVPTRQLLILNLFNCNIKALSKIYYKHKRKMANISLIFETPSMGEVFPVRNSKSILIWLEISEFSCKSPRSSEFSRFLCFRNVFA